MLQDKVAACNGVQKIGHSYKLLRCGLRLTGCDLGAAHAVLTS